MLSSLKSLLASIFNAYTVPSHSSSPSSSSSKPTPIDFSEVQQTQKLNQLFSQNTSSDQLALAEADVSVSRLFSDEQDNVNISVVPLACLHVQDQLLQVVHARTQKVRFQLHLTSIHHVLTCFEETGLVLVTSSGNEHQLSAFLFAIRFRNSDALNTFYETLVKTKIRAQTSTELKETEMDELVEWNKRSESFHRKPPKDEEEEEEEDGDGEEEEYPDRQPHLKNCSQYSVASLSSSSSSSSTTTNSNHTMGHSLLKHKQGMTLISRGNLVGLFKEKDREEGLEYKTCYNTDDIQPHKLVLANQSKHSWVLDKKDPHKVSLLDIETGKFVTHMRGPVENWSMNEITPNYKLAEQEAGSDQLVKGLNSISLFLMDSRLRPGQNVVQQKLYHSDSKGSQPLFSKMATTQEGCIATGSLNGSIRLFDSTIGSRAKTLFPGLGDPILGMDVTNDGEWVLATCPRYLLLVHTKDSNQEGAKNGFQTSISASAATPIKLRLHPQDLLFCKLDFNKDFFTEAHFDTFTPTGTGARKERKIITSIGKYMIIWNFSRLADSQGRRGHFSYLIKHFDENVVSDRFLHDSEGDEEKVLITLANNVLLEKVQSSHVKKKKTPS